MNAVYFFRNVDYLNTITLNPVDIICAVRPHGRRIAVLHLILQNGRQLSRTLHYKLFEAIEDYNRVKRREDQRPRWGIHMTDAHVLAITDTPVPTEVRQEIDATAKARTPTIAKATSKPSSTPSVRSASSTSSVRPSDYAPTPKQPPTPPPAKGGKGQDRGRQSASHRGGDWNKQNYTGGRYERRDW